MCGRFAVCVMLVYSLAGVEIMLRLSFNLSILALVFALGKFSYFGESGFGIFVAGVGGYHVAFDDSESGVYQ